MNIPALIVIGLIVAFYGGYFLWYQWAKNQFGYGETPQEANDWFAGTKCHCYSDGTRVWFDRDGNVIEYDAGDMSPVVGDDSRRYM